jgi:hypothetical protein
LPRTSLFIQIRAFLLLPEQRQPYQAMNQLDVSRRAIAFGKRSRMEVVTASHCWTNVVQHYQHGQIFRDRSCAKCLP